MFHPVTRTTDGCSGSLLSYRGIIARMPLEIGMWRVDSGVQQLGQGGIELESRLEDILHANISMLSPNWMVVGRQVKTPHEKRIDLLCMDRDGNLIVVELKRDMTERETVAQILDYGSWVRTVKDDEIARIFDAYRRNCFPDEKPISINEKFCSHFNLREMPEEINDSHELVIVGSSFDPATERIVEYLAAEYRVRINAVFFRVFKGGDREYLTRVWLREPTYDDTVVDDPRLTRNWNGEYYVSFGQNPQEGRLWEDAVKYGFVSAGGGMWYTQTLRMLQPGNRIWVNVPGGVGYVGVGIVEKPSIKVDQFLVDGPDGKRVPILGMPPQGNMSKDWDDPLKAEYLVRVKWLKTVPLNQGIREKGFFGNQNTVARPTSPAWVYTVQRLKEKFGIS